MNSATIKRRTREVGVSVGLTGLVAYLLPAWAIHSVATRLASARHVPEPRQIPRRRIDPSALDSVMDDGQPVILEGLLDDLGLADVATPDSLVAIAADDQIDVDFHDATAPYFLYSGGYGARVSEHQKMSVADFVELMFRRGLDPDVVVYRLFGHRAVGGKVANVLDAFDSALAAVSKRRGEPRFSGVWVGSPGVVTPLHHDAWPGLLFQTHGTKRLTMFSPRDRTNLYFRAPFRGQGRWSELPARSSDATSTEFPRIARAARWEGELQRGEALYIPPFWAHEMEASEANISVPFRFATNPRSYLDPGFLRPAAEMLRVRSDVRSGTR